MYTPYIQVDFFHLSPEETDILLALLAEAGWEGFEEDGDRFSAYIPQPDFSEESLRQLAHSYTFQWKEVPYINWNQQWESSFDPVVVDDFCAVRAAFHTPVIGVKHEIIITPRQSFGTGHHATTYLMMKQMEQLELTGKSVLDFGTGTGILAILAEKAGAQTILGIEHEEWSIENARENGEENQCHRITWQWADRLPETGTHEVILANINKNVILEHFPVLVQRLSPEGVLVLSGLLSTDETDIREAAKRLGLHKTAQAERSGWICLTFKR